MQRLLNLFSAHPWWVLAVLLLVSVGAASRLQHVQVHVSADELHVINDPERVYFEKIKKLFGDEEVILLVLEDDAVLEPEKLKVLQGVIGQLEAMPFVDRVESLFTIPHLRSVDGYLKTDPYLDELPETAEAAEAIEQRALESPFVRNVLLSQDGRTMAAAIVLDKALEEDEYAVTAGIDEAIQGLAGVYDGFFAIGFPYVRVEIANKLGEEQGQLFPLAVGALLIALFILLRQVVDILTPILTSGLSILWTLGLMGVVGIPLNVVTSIVPILLIIVGSTEDIHLLAEFRRGQATGLGTDRALQHMAEKMGRTVLLTFVTTFAGFLSIGLSRIEVLWQFGLVASTGLLLNFVITITLIPALLRLTGGWRLGGAAAPITDRGLVWAEAYWRGLRRHRIAVAGILGAAALGAALGIPRIELNHNATDNLADDSGVRAQVTQVSEQLAGMESVSIIIGSGIEDTFLKVRYLEELAEIQSFIAEQGVARSTTSFVDYLALMNGVLQEVDGPRMPVNDDEVYELMIFLDHDHVKGYVTEDYSTARILVRHDISSTRALQAFMDDLRAFLDEKLDAGLDARITGDSVLTLSATRNMVAGQLQSVVLLLVFVVLTISILFTDLKVGLLAALPNVFPLIVLFGVMGYADIPLNVGTTMAAAIAIGLAVDDTIHFMHNFRRYFEQSGDPKLAVYQTLHTTGRAMLVTTIVLSLGFLIFVFATMKNLFNFGLLTAFTILMALVADYFVAPALMVVINRPRKTALIG